MHAKYEVSISYGSKAMAKVVFFPTESQTDRKIESQTGQKLGAPEFHSGGIKSDDLQDSCYPYFTVTTTIM